jgi:hypothetical protein
LGADSAGALQSELQDFSPHGDADDKENQAHQEKEKEQEFCNSRGSRRDAGKSEQGGDECDNKKNNSPT